MTTSSEFMIKAIADTLRDGVLPALEPASWPAGNLRACLMLLAYLEDRVKLEGPALFESNTKLRALLGEIASGKDLPPDAELTRLANSVLQQHPARSTFVDVEDLARENTAYQQAVTQIIRHAHSRRDDLDPALYDNLRSKLDACAFAAAAPENAFTRQAMTMVPI